MRWVGLSSALQKAAWLAEQELARVHPRKQLGLLVAGALPHLAFNHTRTALLRMAGLHIGQGSLVMGQIVLTGEGEHRSLFSVGRCTMITGPLYIDLGERVEIGDLVRIGHEVMILTVDHEVGDAVLRCGPHRPAPVRIGNGAWIGSRAILLPGITVGAGAVVAAGAVVSRSVPANTLVGGVPARVIRELGTAVS
jgi:maltose O-acetyltransferase